MARAATPSFVAEFELREGSPGAFRAVDRVETLARKLANSALGLFQGRVRAMKRSPAWQAARLLLKGEARNAAFERLRQQYGLTEYALSAKVTKMKNASPDFQRYLGAHVTQKVAARVWRAIEKLIFAKSRRVRFKSSKEPFSFEGKNNKTFLRFSFGQGPLFTPFVLLDGAVLVADWDRVNPYHRHAAQHPVKYCRIVKRRIRKETRYFVQVTLGGFAYRDLVKEEQHAARLASELLGPAYEAELAAVEAPYQGRVAVDFGPSRVAISTPVVGVERDIAGEIKDKSKARRREQRHIDRQLRAANPGNFNPDGTVRKGRKDWVRSKACQQAQARLADICRRETAQRKSIHGNLAYDVLALGREIITEKESIKGWQRSRFGRSIAKHGPSALKGTLTRKAENARGRLVQVNTFQTALSQTCLCGERRKKALSERFHRCEICGLGRDRALPRDTFSAYLALFTESETVSRKRAGSKVVSSRLDLAAALRHAPGHRTLSCVLSASAPLREPWPASRPAVVEAESNHRVEVQTRAASSAARGHERRVPGGLGAKRSGRAGQESATEEVGKRRVPVRKAAKPEASGIPFS